MKTIIESVLQSKQSWSNITPLAVDFGFQIGDKSLKDIGIQYYIDFWLFDDGSSNGKVTCIGRNTSVEDSRYTSGCAKSYHYMFNGKKPPKFETRFYLPPIYQVFGTHKLPIPRTSSELETFQYSGESEYWNKTCGAHQLWDPSGKKFIPIPKEDRVCSLRYNEYPFVFKTTMTNLSLEELRQGSVVIHSSCIDV